MGGRVAAHQMGRAAAYTPLRRPLLKGRNHLRMVGQSQIIITAETQHGTAVHHHLRPLGRIHNPPGAVEMIPLSLFQLVSQYFHRKAKTTEDTEKHREKIILVTVSK
jgi:hypothetical protein